MKLFTIKIRCTLDLSVIIFLGSCLTKIFKGNLYIKFSLKIHILNILIEFYKNIVDLNTKEQQLWMKMAEFMKSKHWKINNWNWIITN